MWWRLRAIVVVGAAACCLSSAAAAATCTTVEHAQRATAAISYEKRMAAERIAFAKTHKSAAQRKAFAARQRARLAALKTAATCTVVVPPPPSVTVTVAPDVAAQDADEIRAATEGAKSFYTKIGVTFSGAKILVYGSPESTAQAYAPYYSLSIDNARAFWSTNVAAGGEGLIFIDTGAPYWHDARTTAVDRAKIVAHEMFHLAQSTFAGPAWDIDRGPIWLLEGGAEWMGYAAVANGGLTSAAETRADQVARSKYATGPLSGYADNTAYSKPVIYPLSFVAVDRLVSMRGVQSQLDLWRAIGRGVPWSVAFQDVYGLTIEAFYAEFESYRATL